LWQTLGYLRSDVGEFQQTGRAGLLVGWIEALEMMADWQSSGQSRESSGAIISGAISKKGLNSKETLSR
jgi:hypothetical protein